MKQSVFYGPAFSADLGPPCKVCFVEELDPVIAGSLAPAACAPTSVPHDMESAISNRPPKQRRYGVTFARMFLRKQLIFLNRANVLMSM